MANDPLKRKFKHADKEEFQVPEPKTKRPKADLTLAALQRAVKLKELEAALDHAENATIDMGAIARTLRTAVENLRANKDDDKKASSERSPSPSAPDKGDSKNQTAATAATTTDMEDDNEDQEKEEEDGYGSDTTLTDDNATTKQKDLLRAYHFFRFDKCLGGEDRIFQNYWVMLENMGDLYQRDFLRAKADKVFMALWESGEFTRKD